MATATATRASDFIYIYIYIRKYINKSYTNILIFIKLYFIVLNYKWLNVVVGLMFVSWRLSRNVVSKRNAQECSDLDLGFD